MKKEVGKVKVVYVLIVCMAFVLGVLGTIFYMTHIKAGTSKGEAKSDVSVKTPEQYDGQYHTEKYNDTDYYIIDNDYTGECDIHIINLYDPKLDSKEEEEREDDFKVNKVMSFEEYSEFCKKFNLEQKYENEDKNYIAYSYVAISCPNLDVRLADVEFKSKKVKLYIWDRSSGMTADCMAYVIFIPTENNINNIEVEPLLTIEEFNDAAGISPVEGKTFTVEDNKVMADNAYVETDDKEIDQIINTMLDNMAKEHTIEIHSKYSNETLDTQFDLISSTRKSVSTNNNMVYGIYAEHYGKRYVAYGNNVYETYEKMDGQPRENLLFDVAAEANIDIITDYAFPHLSPYNYSTGYNEKKNLNLSYEADNYVITYYKEDTLGKLEETYYINKKTDLLERVDYKKYANDGKIDFQQEHTFKYTDAVVTVPKKVIQNSGAILVDKN